MTEQHLQHIWAAHPMAGKALTSRCGKSIRIADPGRLNTTDGPDFLDARVIINGIALHGAIELHLKSSGWFAHKHHLDKAYDAVVLHVVLNSDGRKISRSEGSVIPEVAVGEFLHELLKHTETLREDRPICPVDPVFISKEALERQVEKVRSDYFSRKVDDYFAFFDPAAGMEIAWKKALITSFFDGMGIPHNRKTFRKAAVVINQQLFGRNDIWSEDHKTAVIKELAALDWKSKSVFHATHPGRVLPAILHVAAQIKEIPFSTILKEPETGLWDRWMAGAGLATYYKPRVLKATVFFPALYAASALTAQQKLGEYAYEEWKKYQVLLPESIRREFAFMPAEALEYASKQLPMVHQVREWCMNKRCSECEVLKRAFAS
jgi:hypothetical protein